MFLKSEKLGYFSMYFFTGTPRVKQYQFKDSVTPAFKMEVHSFEWNFCVLAEFRNLAGTLCKKAVLTDIQHTKLIWRDGRRDISLSWIFEKLQRYFGAFFNADIQLHSFLLVRMADTVICHFSGFCGLFRCVEAGGGFIFQQAKFKSKAEQGGMTGMKLTQIPWTSVSVWKAKRWKIVLVSFVFFSHIWGKREYFLGRWNPMLAPRYVFFFQVLEISSRAGEEGKKKNELERKKPPVVESWENLCHSLTHTLACQADYGLSAVGAAGEGETLSTRSLHTRTVL